MNRLLRPFVTMAAVAAVYCWWQVESAILEHLLCRNEQARWQQLDTQRQARIDAEYERLCADGSAS